MSCYSTGELAKLAGVSVRTVQYYDQRGILQPSDLTEGGRRIYTDQDFQKLQVICFLRDLDFSIEQIKRVLSEENADAVLEMLLADQVSNLKSQVADQKSKLDTAVNLLDRLKKEPSYSLVNLQDISLSMKNQKSWSRHLYLFLGQIFGTVVLFVLGVFLLQDSWWVYLLIPVYISALLYFIYRYYKDVCYLCPNCHKTFEVKITEFALAGHTPRTRKLTCSHCQTKSYCLELLK